MHHRYLYQLASLLPVYSASCRGWGWSAYPPFCHLCSVHGGTQGAADAGAGDAVHAGDLEYGVGPSLGHKQTQQREAEPRYKQRTAVVRQATRVAASCGHTAPQLWPHRRALPITVGAPCGHSVQTVSGAGRPARDHFRAGSRAPFLPATAGRQQQRSSALCCRERRVADTTRDVGSGAPQDPRRAGV